MSGVAAQGRGTSNGWLFAVIVGAVMAASAAVVAADSPTARTDGGAGARAAAPVSANKVAEPQPPVRISADMAEYFNKEGLVVFTGNVVAVQTDSTLTADRMDVTFEKPARGEEQPAAVTGVPPGEQRITRIVAEKNVTFRQVDPESGKERYATGEKGVYDVDQRLVTMTGNPRLFEGRNVIVGEEMVFYLDEKKVIVKGKVNLTVYPDELKDKKP